MAAGDITLFNQFPTDSGLKVHDLGNDTLRVGLITAAQTPTGNDATPTWGDYSGNQVATGTSYTDKGPALTSVTFNRATAVTTLDAANVTVSQDASGFTNARWGIIYNDTATNDEAIGFIDLGGNVSIQGGDLDIQFAATGIGNVTVA